MRNFVALLILYFVRISLWFRYRVTIKGLDLLNSNTLAKPGGVLFLSNHPTVFVDPSLVTIAVWKKYPLRPMIVEYMYYLPIVNPIMRFMNALPIPHFATSSNTFKKKRADRVLEEVIKDLKNGENFLISPAGKTKLQAREIIGASGVQRIIQGAPEANVVLVRTTGLWGSSFSRAFTGNAPPMFQTIIWGIKKTFKNLLFFNPRRHVTIEFLPAPSDFPYQGSRLEMNRYLEKWYNRPYGIKPQEGDEPGESLNLVSYSLWKEELLQVKPPSKDEAELDIQKIPSVIKEKINKKLSEMTQIPVNQIKPEMDLGTDLGLDSLDVAEVITFLDDEFEVTGVPVSELTTVGKIMGLASKEISYRESAEEDHFNIKKWFAPHPHGQALVAPGETIPEVFFNCCQNNRSAYACGDQMAGILTYSQIKMRVLLLAEYISTLPGEYIGIMLPSSVAAYLTILACQTAGKVPLLINWTVGPRHLESVVSLSGVKVVLSSWTFLDRLENADLTPVEDLIITLEDARHQFTLKDKVKAFYRSKLNTKSLMTHFKLDKISKDAQAVLLFTSGTESLPKGVPLSHENILSNQRLAVEEVGIFKDDVLFGILPPFHSFGFTVTGLLPLLAGIRAVYYPDPTNGKVIAREMSRWGATISGGPPSFLKGIFKSADPVQFKMLRICFTGAEKAPDDLFQLVKRLDHCHLFEGYGITECSPILTMNLSGDPKKGVGKPLKGTEICVVSIDNHTPLSQGEQGLVLARGPNIFSGYINEGLSSPFVVVNGLTWYSTGDLGYLDKDGSLILSGRLKRFIKIGGEMVSLAAIETALQEKVGEKAGMHVEGPILGVCAKEEAGEKTKIVVFTCFPATLDEVNRALRESGFSNLVKIFKVQQISEIPLMGSGKTNYRALEAQLPALIDDPEIANIT